MQAGFPVAPQAPVAMQPRQMVQPLPTGTERTLVAVPQFGVALANALANDGSVDQATVPAAQSATSGQGTLTAMSGATEHIASKPVRMPGLPDPPLDPSIGAAPAERSASIAKREVVNLPGSLRQASAKPIEPPAIPPSQSWPLAADGRVVRNDANRCGRRRPKNGPTADSNRQRTGDRPNRDGPPAMRRHNSTEAPLLPRVPGSRLARTVRCFLCRNPPSEMPWNSPHAAQAAPFGAEAAATAKFDRGHRSCHGDDPHYSRMPESSCGSDPTVQLHPRRLGADRPGRPILPICLRRYRQRLNRSPCRRFKACQPRVRPSIAISRQRPRQTPRATMAGNARANTGVPTLTILAGADEFRSVDPKAPRAAPRRHRRSVYRQR